MHKYLTNCEASARDVYRLRSESWTFCADAIRELAQNNGSTAVCRTCACDIIARWQRWTVALFPGGPRDQGENRLIPTQLYARREMEDGHRALATTAKSNEVVKPPYRWVAIRESSGSRASDVSSSRRPLQGPLR